MARHSIASKIKKQYTRSSNTFATYNNHHINHPKTSSTTNIKHFTTPTANMLEYTAVTLYIIRRRLSQGTRSSTASSDKSSTISK